MEEFLPIQIFSASPIVATPSYIESVPQPDQFPTMPFKNVDLELEEGDSFHVESFTPTETLAREDTAIAAIE